MIRLPSLFTSAKFQRTRSMLDPATSRTVSDWQALPTAGLDGPLAAQRWLVVDVETSGLDMHRDRLLAIGAVIVDGSTIRIENSLEVVLQQAAPSGTDNILVHRITGNEQLSGVPPAQALADFLTFAGKLPCVAFHAAFDETMLRRALATYLGVEFRSPFLDLAQLAPALVNDAPRSLHALDDWTAHFSITIAERHRAVSDAMGTAQLLQKLLSIARRQDMDSAQQLLKLAQHQRWLSGTRQH